MSLETIERGHHVSDDAKEWGRTEMPFSLEELQSMHIPPEEIQAYIIECEDAQRSKEQEIDKHLAQTRASMTV